LLPGYGRVPAGKIAWPRRCWRGWAAGSSRSVQPASLVPHSAARPIHGHSRDEPAAQLRGWRSPHL